MKKNNSLWNPVPSFVKINVHFYALPLHMINFFFSVEIEIIPSRRWLLSILKPIIFKINHFSINRPQIRQVGLHPGVLPGADGGDLWKRGKTSSNQVHLYSSFAWVSYQKLAMPLDKRMRVQILSEAIIICTRFGCGCNCWLHEKVMQQMHNTHTRCISLIRIASRSLSPPFHPPC